MSVFAPDAPKIWATQPRIRQIAISCPNRWWLSALCVAAPVDDETT